MAIFPNGRNLYLWDDQAEDLLPYEWRGKVWDLPFARTMPFARVRARAYSSIEAEFTINETTLLQESTPQSAEVFRLRERGVSPYLAIDVTIRGTERVQSIEVADNVDELSGVIG